MTTNYGSPGGFPGGGGVGGQPTFTSGSQQYQLTTNQAPQQFVAQQTGQSLQGFTGGATQIRGTTTATTGYTTTTTLPQQQTFGFSSPTQTTFTTGMTQGYPTTIGAPSASYQTS